jgi:biotin transport system substrate-specific component
MSRSIAQVSTRTPALNKPLTIAAEVLIVVAASLFVALCARVTVPLPFTPVPLTLQNLGVLLVGLTLGSRRGAAALALYIAEGAAGLPVFNPLGLGGVAQLIGPTGGFLIAYPAVAFVAGFIAERRERKFVASLIGATAAELVLFIGGISWLAVLTHSIANAARFAAYPFVSAELVKILLAAAVVSRLPLRNRSASGAA